MKTCFHCRVEKPLSSFYTDNSRPDGKRPRCKECEKLYINREARRAYEKQYREKNKDRRRDIVKRSMLKNKQHHLEQRRAYLATPQGRAMYRKQTQTRYALKKAAFVEVVDPQEVYVDQLGRCYLCGSRGYFRHMELDHIQPFALGGLHERSNCAIACLPCNRSKGAKPLEEYRHQMV